MYRRGIYSRNLLRISRNRWHPGPNSVTLDAIRGTIARQYEVACMPGAIKRLGIFCFANNGLPELTFTVIHSKRRTSPWAYSDVKGTRSLSDSNDFLRGSLACDKCCRRRFGLLPMFRLHRGCKNLVYSFVF